MSMKAMYDLRDMLCKELDEIAHKGELGAGDLDIAHKLVSRDGAKDDMKRQLQEMLDNADDDTIRNAIQRCMDAVEG